MNTKAAYLWQPYMTNNFILCKKDDNVSFLDGTVDSLSKDEFYKN